MGLIPVILKKPLKIKKKNLNKMWIGSSATTIKKKEDGGSLKN